LFLKAKITIVNYSVKNNYIATVRDMNIIWMIVIGFIAGLVARALKPGNDSMGIIMTSILGIAGSLVAGFIGKALGWYQEGELTGFIASVIGAIIILFIFGMLKKK
jgi:uncharacterized membrane protein YeaQ/YmgE (transglycosylase-associated protein family)